MPCAHFYAVKHTRGHQATVQSKSCGPTARGAEELSQQLSVLTDL